MSPTVPLVSAEIELGLRVERERLGADMPRIPPLDVDGAPEWWPINQVTRTGDAATGRPAVPCG